MSEIQDRRESIEFEMHEIDRCPICKHKLKKKKGNVTRIVFTLKAPTVEIVKHICSRGYCSYCEKEFYTPVPNALPGSKFDLTIVVLISVLYIGMNLSEEKIAELLSFFGLDISKSTVSNILKRLKEYLGDDYKELQKRVLDAKAKCKDETGWRHNGKTNWVWVTTTAKDICYWIEETRSYKTARKLFKDDKGISTTDGYKVYDMLNRQIQRDWAHLFRKTKNPEYWFTSEDEVREYKCLVNQLRKLYHDAKEDKVKFGASKRLKEEYEKRLFGILASVRNPERNASRLINYIMHYNFDWFVFLEHKEVQQTSNAAERALRHIVIKRKISQQTRSEENKQSYAMQVSLYQTAKLRDQIIWKCSRTS